MAGIILSKLIFLWAKMGKYVQPLKLISTKIGNVGINIFL